MFLINAFTKVSFCLDAHHTPVATTQNSPPAILCRDWPRVSPCTNLQVDKWF